MYVTDFDQFFEAAQKLFLQSPSTRYSIKYRHQDGKMVLKVTDDQVCIKYRTDQLDDLKKIEKLNNLFVRQMTEIPDRRKAQTLAASQ